MAHGQDQGNGVGPLDGTKTETVMTKDQTDSNGSIERLVNHTTFHCCKCYEKAVAYDHANLDKELMERAVSVAGDVVIDAKFNKEDTEIARVFIMEFIAKQKAKL